MKGHEFNRLRGLIDSLSMCTDLTVRIMEKYEIGVWFGADEILCNHPVSDLGMRNTLERMRELGYRCAMFLDLDEQAHATFYKGEDLDLAVLFLSLVQASTLPRAVAEAALKALEERNA